MTFNTRNHITYPDEAQFFLGPESPLHRQYEALRAFFVEELPGPQVARRFGYSPNALRVLCYQFRHDAQKRSSFFQHPKPGPHQAPVRDRVRQRAVALRKKNLSIYDIQRELALAGHSISINALAVLMREEGFARLPRRRDDERPPTLKPEAAAVANIHELDLSPRSFRTDFGGLFLFVPLMRPLDLPAVARQAHLPGSGMIPAPQALRSLLALKLVGQERKSHVMDWVFDQGLALFAGLNVIPKRSYLAAYSSGIGQRTNTRLMETWFEHVGQAVRIAGRRERLKGRSVAQQIANGHRAFARLLFCDADRYAGGMVLIAAEYHHGMEAITRAAQRAAGSFPIEIRGCRRRGIGQGSPSKTQ